MNEDLTYEIKGYEFSGDEKPPCYGHYFDKQSTVARNLELGCFSERKKSRKYKQCKYWTFNDDSCPMISIKR